MKRVFLTIIFISNLCFAQNNESIYITKTKVTLKNEFGIAYPNKKIVFESKNNFLELIVDENGEGILNLNQGEKFIVSCYINNEAFQFEEAIFIEKNKNIYSAEIDLQFDFYESIFEIKNLNFKSGKFDIEEKYFNDLEKLVDLLIDEKDINIEIAGHTDSIGIDQANQILSENRAKRVKSFLVRNKINHNRITCIGYGEKQPISTNSTTEGRKKNRRIKIRILK